MFKSNSHRDSTGARQVALLTLGRHFFQKFFDNDAVSFEAETQTTVVRSLCTVAVPPFFVCCMVLTLGGVQSPWVIAGQHYLFVLYSFTLMGCLAVVQWQTVFPDRIDFLILLPLPLSIRTMFLAKLAAISQFFGMFLVAANLCAMILIPLGSGHHLFRHFLGHTTAILCAGIAAMLAIMTIEGIAICLLPETWFRKMMPVMQTLLMGGLLLMAFCLPYLALQLPGIFIHDLNFALCFPPLWYLALYECIVGGATATHNAWVLARLSVYSLVGLIVLMTFIYPAAWAKRKRAALEGTRAKNNNRGLGFAALLHKAILRTPQERALFHFITQTISRISRYHVYIAVYLGAGLAICIASAVEIVMKGESFHFVASTSGLHAAIPLLLFWLIIGLRGAFLLPADLSARWIFKMVAVDPSIAVSVAKTWVLMCSLPVILAVIGVLALDGWDYRHLLIQLVFGVVSALLLTEASFLFHASIPFTRPRLPGRTSLPLTLAVFLFSLPAFLESVLWLEGIAEAKPWVIMLVFVGTLIVSLSVHRFRRTETGRLPEDAFADEMETDIMGLNLSA